MKIPSGERAKTTVDRQYEQLVAVVGHGETVVKFLAPTTDHPQGSWYVESDCPLDVVKVSGGRRKVLRFKSGSEAEEVTA